MSSVVQVAIHPSQFPHAVHRDLLASLRSRRLNHKFHYDSAKQTQKWLAVHQAHSPSRTDADCAATYDQAFAAAAAHVAATAVHLIGLGCGGGQKDTRMLRLLSQGRRRVRYTPADVSVAMVLAAREAALTVVSASDCFPLVCDLATATDLPDVLDPPPTARRPARLQRLITFFGMIPNFEPADILPKLTSLVRPGDWLLFSANLAPGDNYAAGMRRVLPQYDNPLTRDWLLIFLLDLGVERKDGELRFKLEDGADRNELKKIVAAFHFTRRRRIAVEGATFDFGPGDVFQLFFSYRYTPSRVCGTLAGHGLDVLDSWISRSGEEGVFLVRRHSIQTGP